jgi:hypothetical protein
MSSYSDPVFEDLQSLQEEYQVIRDCLISEFEQQYQLPYSLKDKDLSNPPHLKTAELAYQMIGMNLEELERSEEEDSQKYQEFFYSEIYPKILEKAKISAQQSIPSNLKSKDSWIGEATPYSTLVLATERKLLEEILPNTDIHNPWAEKQGQDYEGKQLKIDQWGSGSGLYLFFPDYLKGDRVELIWSYIWKPTPAISHAKAFRLHLYFNSGAYACYADDCWYNSKYAKIGLEMKMQFASSNYQSPAHLQTITRYEDDNINVSGTIDNMIQPRTFTVPAPKGYEDKLLWIWGGIVAEGFVRGGGSHAMIDLSAHPFGVWCKGVEVIP